jgi:hypothetical protein
MLCRILDKGQNVLCWDILPRLATHTALQTPLGLVFTSFLQWRYEQKLCR